MANLMITLRLCLFWVKITSGNAFPEMRLFGWSRKFYFPEIEIRWPKKNAFDHGNHFTLLFSLQSISEKWERERARARERRSVERNLAVVRSCRWSRSRTRAGARAVFAFVGLELARSARTGAWSLPAIVELTRSSPLARALSLSLIFRKCFEGKIEV